MSSNPYAPPRAPSSALEERLRRRRWIAVLLALLAPPIAMLYVVRPLRALVYLAAGILIMPGAILAGVRGIADPGMLVFGGFLAWRLVGAVEGYRLAPRWHGAALPWFSRPVALVGFLAAGWLSIGALRAFVVEPFRIPAASMRPTLQVGDHILVSKTAYGWDIPLTHRRILRFGSPLRADVAVFRYPPDPNLNYVMRVVGLPGETIAYAGKRLSINGREQPLVEEGAEQPDLQRYAERLGEVTHLILIDPTAPPLVASTARNEQCRFDTQGFECKVPAEHYFVMGDNRDNASDSRYWGFVPEDHFIGRVSMIWYSERASERAGKKVQ